MTIPTDVRECVITKYQDEKEWYVSTSDTTQVTRLKRAGYTPVGNDGTGYWNFRVPAKCISFRRAPKKGAAARRNHGFGARKTAGGGKVAPQGSGRGLKG